MTNKTKERVKRRKAPPPEIILEGETPQDREEKETLLAENLGERLAVNASPVEAVSCLVETILKLEFPSLNKNAASWKRMKRVITEAVLANPALKKEALLFSGQVQLKKLSPENPD